MLSRLVCYAALSVFVCNAAFPVYHTELSKNELRFREVDTQHHASGSITKTYLSPPMKLRPGEVVFTDPTKTPLEMPTGKIAIQKFAAEVVDEKNVSTPLSEVYDHHWLVFDGSPSSKSGNAGVCGGYLSYIFGVGAESRNSPMEYPDGYGYQMKGTEQWGANIHLLRTVDIEGGAQGTKDCIECKYWEGRSPGCHEDESGLFACCGDGTFCKTTAKGKIGAAKTYYLRYAVTYTTNVNSVKPLALYVFDSSNCKIEYNIAADAKSKEHMDLCWTVPENGAGEIVFAQGHQHIGGEKISLLHGPTHRSAVSICDSYPTYGTAEGVPGNEKGYLTAMSHCNRPNVTIKAGEQICVNSTYIVDPKDQRSAPIPGGSHGGVMSLFYAAVHLDKVTENHHQLDWVVTPV